MLWYAPESVRTPLLAAGTCAPPSDQLSQKDVSSSVIPPLVSASGGVMTVVFVDRRVGKSTRSMMRRGRVAKPADFSPRSPWPAAPESDSLDAAWPDWKVGPRLPATRCGVVDLYTTRMVRSGALPPRPGAGPPRQRPGGVGRPIVKVGRGTFHHEVARRPGPCPTYRRLRVGGPLRPLARGRSAWWLGPIRDVVAWIRASPRTLVATLTLVIVLISAASTGFA